MKFIGSKTMRILFLLFLFPGALSAASPVTIEKGKEIYPLAPHVSILEDKTGLLSVTEAVRRQAEFRDNTKKEIGFGFSQSAYWTHFTLQSESRKSTTWFLELANARMQKIDLYIFQNKKLLTHKKSGIDLPFHRRDIDYRFFIFTLHLKAPGELSVFIRTETRTSHFLPLTLYSSEALAEKRQTDYAYSGLFYGCILIMFIYNLFLFFSIRSSDYLFYVCTVLFSLLYTLSFEGFGYQFLWSHSPNWNLPSPLIAGQITIVFFIIFSTGLLRTADYLPRLHRFLKGANYVLIVTLFGHFFIDYYIMNYIFTIFLSIIIFSFVPISFFIVKMGNRSARFFIFTFLCLLLASTLHVINLMGMLEESFPTINIVRISLLILLTFFSLALADYINLMREQLMEQNIRLQKLDELKDEFLAGTSHELRTPLNGIIGLAESMIQGIGAPHREQTLSNLRMISSSGRRLARLVNDILDFSRLRHRDIILQKKAVDLNPMVDMVFRFSRSMMGDKEIKLLNECGSLPLLLGDENRLEQILYNLIGNAVKFTDEGSVTVLAKAAGGMAEISVCDTGIGIPEEKRDIIFESFQQGDGSISRKYGGTGLGLSITKNLVELHGGTIRVESSPSASLGINPSVQLNTGDSNKQRGGPPAEPRGSCFIFTIPLADEKDLAEAKDDGREKVHRFLSPDPVLMETPPGEETQRDAAPGTEMKKFTDTGGLPEHTGRCTILAVDDDIINLQVIENHLSLKGYRVITARNGTRALEILEGGEKTDLVLLDLMMPGLNGYEVCRIIREKYNPNELPVIILTAKNNISDLADGLAFGANDFIPKPFSFPELTSRVENQVKMSRFFLNIKDLNENLERKIEERTAELKETMVELRSANTAKNRFLSIISHDLRGPIGNLAKVFNSVAGKGSDISDTLFQQLRETTISVSHMLEDLLIWAALQREKLEIHPENFDICRGANLAADPMRLLARSRKITLNLPDENESIKILAESRSVITVLRNLISNAIKYTSAGGSISVEVKRENDTVKVSVTDTGRGITEEKLKELLNPERADSVKIDSEKEQVSGFGLMLCRYFIEANGGEIGAESVINRGSTFWFRLPAGEGTG